MTNQHRDGMSVHNASIPSAGLVHLFVVYVIWGSTFLAIRVAVREGSGFPPFIMAAMRVLAAGSLLLLWAATTRNGFKLSKAELAVLAGSGILLWLGGNGLVTWAEQRADSGYAALIVGSIPMWVALIESFIDRRAPSLLLILSLLVGFAGLGLLTAPVLIRGSRADLLGVVALLFAAISWGVGSILQSRKPVRVQPLVSSGYQHVFGGLGFVSTAFLLGEPAPSPTIEAWWAWTYLVIFGSVFGFTSFVKALRLLPTSIAMTYAYVNPVIAVILGSVILNEPITVWNVAGTALVLVGVAGVFRGRYSKTR